MTLTKAAICYVEEGTKCSGKGFSSFTAQKSLKLSQSLFLFFIFYKGQLIQIQHIFLSFQTCTYLVKKQNINVIFDNSGIGWFSSVRFQHQLMCVASFCQFSSWCSEDIMREVKLLQQNQRRSRSAGKRGDKRGGGEEAEGQGLNMHVTSTSHKSWHAASWWFRPTLMWDRMLSPWLLI